MTASPFYLTSAVRLSRAAVFVFAAALTTACGTSIDLGTTSRAPGTASVPASAASTAASRPAPAPNVGASASTVPAPGQPTAPTAAAEPFAVTLPELPAPDTVQLQSWTRDHNRLYTVAAPLMIDNADLCPNNARRILGFTAKTRYSYSLDFVLAAEAELGLDDHLRITNVLPESGAAQAGVREGDVLVAINGHTLPQGENAEREAARVLAAETRGRTEVELAVGRDNEEFLLNVPLTQACAFGIELGNMDYVASLADGYRVLISRGMLRALQNDTELAYVIAHEFAHNLIISRPRPDVSAFIDQARFISLAGQAPLPPLQTLPAATLAEETHADELALYMLARAGVAIDGYANFWRLLEAVAPDYRLHAPIDQREAAIARVSKSIARKKVANAPLQP